MWISRLIAALCFHHMVTGLPHNVPSTKSPKLAVIGLPEVVWNQTSDSCQGIGKNPFGHPWEQPDSMPIAWHNPLTNTSFLISATGKTYATVGPSLSELKKHDCSHQVYKAVNDTRPWAYANHQWMQAVRVFKNGSGFALVHNEFHGEQEHNKSYCSFDKKTPTGQCIEWSTDLSATTDGGETWHMVHAPLLTLPRRYIKDGPMAGYGALGSLLHEDGWYYGHVFRRYHNGTGAGPPGTSAAGVCVWRSRDPTDPASFRGWNGTAWGTKWIDPYTSPTIPADELWQYTCKTIDTGLGLDNGGAHPNPKKFASAWRPKGWPAHVMLNWPEGKKNLVSYSFPMENGEPFTSWVPSQILDISGWLDPHILQGDLMYPALLDHDSPFSLSEQGDEAADGLSYSLVGNRSLHLYLVFGRKLIVRVPVAWFDADSPVPPEPFPMPPLNRANCSVVSVSGAGLHDVNGEYTRKPKTRNIQTLFEKDNGHQIYCYGAAHKCRWTMAHKGTKVFYTCDPRNNGASGVPISGWMGATLPYPTVTCSK